MAYREYKHIGKCPVCGESVVDKGPLVECRTNRYRKGADGKFERIEGCGFRIWKTICGKELSEDVLKQLIEKGATDEKVEGFVSKRTGKSFSAKLKLREDHSIEFIFDQKPKAEEPKAPVEEKYDVNIESDELPF